MVDSVSESSRSKRARESMEDQLKTVERLKELATKMAACYRVDKFPGAVHFTNVLKGLEGMNTRTLQQQIVDKINARTCSFVDDEGNVQLPETIEWTNEVFVIQNMRLADFWSSMSERNRELTASRLGFIVASAFVKTTGLFDPTRYDEATVEDEPVSAAEPEVQVETCGNEV